MSTSVKDLWDDAEGLKAKITTLQHDLDELHKAIAAATCPFKVGDILVGKYGLAVTGVQVTGILPSKFPCDTNQWMIETVALSKAGVPTRRIVTFEEWDITDNELRVKK